MPVEHEKTKNRGEFIKQTEVAGRRLLLRENINLIGRLLSLVELVRPNEITSEMRRQYGALQLLDEKWDEALPTASSDDLGKDLCKQVYALASDATQNSKLYTVCPTCQTVLHVVSAFCTSCGRSTAGAMPVRRSSLASSAPDDTMRTYKFCSNCEGQNSASARFCQGCGLEFLQDSPSIDKPPHMNTGAIAPLGRLMQEDRALGDEVRAAVEQELSEISEWSNANSRDASKDSFAFWALKGPAIVCSASSAAFEALGWSVAVIGLGLVSAVCVAIDGAYPRGRLYNVHKRAAHDLRQLHHDVRSKFTQIRLGKRPDEELIDVLEMARRRRASITSYLRAAEASLGLDAPPIGSDANVPGRRT